MIRTKWKALIEATDSEQESVAVMAMLTLILLAVVAMAAYALLATFAFTTSPWLGTVFLVGTLYWAITRGYRYATTEGK